MIRGSAVPILVGAIIIHLASPDSCAQWVKTNGPCGASGTVLSMAANGVDLFAASLGDLYRSTDKGNTWSRVYSLNSTMYDITSLASSPSHVYASINYPGSSLLWSSDGGLNWSMDTLGAPAPYDLFALASLDSIVLACSAFGSGAAGMFRSTDNGTSWARVRPSGVVSYAVQGSNVFAAVSNQGPDPYGVYFSSDAGATWSGTGLSGTAVYSVALYGSTVFAGSDSSLYRSTDNGVTWNVALFTRNQVNAIAVSPTGSCVYAGTDSGMVRSTDLGKTWFAMNTGLTAVPVYSLAVFPAGSPDTSYVFAGTGGGIFRSIDHGVTWRVSGLPNHQSLPSMSLASDNAHIFAGSGYIKNNTIPTFHHTGRFFFPDPAANLFVSTDDGSTWREMDSGLSVMHTELTSLLSVGSDVYAGTSPNGVFHSANSGASWTGSSSGMTNMSVSALASNGSEMYAGIGFIQGIGTGRVEISTNMGLTWSAADSGLPNSIFQALAMSGSNVFAGATVRGGTPFNPTYSNAVFLTANQGASWALIDWQPIQGAYPQISCLSADGATIIIGTGGETNNNDISFTYYPVGGVCRLTYDGQTWTRSDSALTGNFVTSIASTGHNFFAGTYTAGVFASSDDGVSWRSIGDGLTDVSVGALVIKGANLFAATSSGVWKRPLSEITSVPPVQNALPQKFDLEQNYPNPFNPSTTIRFSLPKRSRIALTVFNTLGQQVAVLASGDLDPGTLEVRFDGGELASGVYFYRLKAGDYLAVKKLLLLR